jgi:competence protein ComEC
MRDAALPDVDLLVAGHHGSKNSTSQALLNTVRPETVFISVGENNAYGHPAKALLDRLSDFGCEIWRTDLHGTIIFRR